MMASQPSTTLPAVDGVRVMRSGWVSGHNDSPIPQKNMPQSMCQAPCMHRVSKELGDSVDATYVIRAAVDVLARAL